MVAFIDESQDRHYLLLSAVTLPSTDTATAIIAHARKTLGPASKKISEFHESALNLVNPSAINSLVDSMTFAYYRHGTRRILRQDVGIWTAYYRKTRPERSAQSLAFPRLLTAYVRLFHALISEIQPERGTRVLCDGFQGIARILPDLQDIADVYRATVAKGESSMAGIQLADVAAGTARRFLSEQNTERYVNLKKIERLHRQVVLLEK